MHALISLPVLMVILAGLFLAGLGLSYKMAAVNRCRPMAFSVVFLLVATVLAGGRALCEATAWENPRLWALGGVMGVLSFGSLVLFVQVNTLGPASVSWTMLNLSLLVPILLAPFVLGESFRALDGVLIVLFLLIVVVLQRGMRGAAEDVKSRSRAFWPLLAAVFLMNGAFQFGAKLKDTLFHEGSAAGLATLYFGSGLLLAVLTHAAQTRSLRFTAREWGVGLLAGGCAGFGNLLFLNGMSLPTVVAFPLTQGIALVGGVALTTVVYAERLNPAKIIGFLLSLAVLMLAVLRDPLQRWLR